jgi:uncharacterized protein (TIGR02611 family)
MTQVTQHQPDPDANLEVSPVSRHQRVRHWARRRRSTHLALKATVFLVGVALVVAGLAMLVLPGPGWAAIILGLVILASEFAWAERALAPVRAAAERGLDAVRALPGGRVILGGLVVLGVAAFLAGLAALVAFLR